MYKTPTSRLEGENVSFEYISTLVKLKYQVSFRVVNDVFTC